MRLIKVLGAAIVAVLAFSAIAAAGASAHEFESANTGLLLAKSHGPQLFNFNGKEVVCNTLKGHGTVTALKTKTQVATVSYSGCSTTFGTVTEPINAEYNFSAEGSVDILKPIKVIVTATGLKCEVTVPVQSGLKTITYKNISPEILLTANVTGITSSGANSLCTYATEKNGVYTGSALVRLESGGIIKWV